MDVNRLVELKESRQTPQIKPGAAIFAGFACGLLLADAVGADQVDFWGGVLGAGAMIATLPKAAEEAEADVAPGEKPVWADEVK